MFWGGGERGVEGGEGGREGGREEVKRQNSIFPVSRFVTLVTLSSNLMAKL